MGSFDDVARVDADRNIAAPVTARVVTVDVITIVGGIETGRGAGAFAADKVDPNVVPIVDEIVGDLKAVHVPV